MTVLWIFWGNAQGPQIALRELSSLFSPDRWGNESMKCRAIILRSTEFFYFIDDSTGTWRSQGPSVACALRWLGGAPSPPGPSLPCCLCALDTVLSRPLCSSLLPSLPAPLLADLWTYQAGAHLRAFAHVASLVWNALCTDFHIILIPAYLTPPQRDPNLGVSSPAALLFGLGDLPWDHTCALRLPFLRQHHFFMTSPPPPWILGIPASLSVPAPETNLRCCV